MKKIVGKFLLLIPLLICLLLSSFSFPVKSAKAYTSNQIYVIEQSNALENFCFNGHYYAIFGDAESWTEAKKYCEALGGHLATITTKEEDEFIFSKLKSYSKSSCWVGGSDSEKENKWEWVTGEDCSYINWAKGEPNNSGDHMQYYTTRGCWDDTDGKEEKAFLCEWEKKPLPYEATCIKSDNKHLDGAMLYEGHLYKLFTEKKYWSDAKDYCSQIGGHLATINNEAEDKQMFRYVNMFGYTRVLLGASDTEQDGVWEWVTDEPFDFTNFNLGEPNNSGGNEHYLEYYTSTGGWNDCIKEKKAFLCEWSEVCLIGNELKVAHSYETISTTDPTCQKKGSTLGKCSRCEYEKETFVDVVECKYSAWQTVSGNKLIPPIVREKYCEYCGAVQKETDWSYIWLTIISGIGLVLSVFGFINYVKMVKEEN